MTTVGSSTIIVLCMMKPGIIQTTLISAFNFEKKLALCLIVALWILKCSTVNHGLLKNIGQYDHSFAHRISNNYKGMDE